MENLLHVLEEKLTPIAVKLEQNRYLSAVKNSFMAAMPLLIIGSFFILLAYLPINAYTEFMLNTFGADWQRMFTIPNNISMAMMTVYVVIGIGNELAQSYGLDKMAGIFAALASFFVVTPMHPFADDTLGIGIPLGNLGAAGLFVGILICNHFGGNHTLYRKNGLENQNARFGSAKRIEVLLILDSGCVGHRYLQFGTHRL